ncbi:Imidazole glycerol phosphate synthase subunit HisH [Streptomyces antimycoticus]
MNADGLLVPGVGAFAACMTGLKQARGDWIVDRRLAGGRPVMGICVGMQILFARGIEHGVQAEGLDERPGTVEPLQGADVVPHMGWNTVEAPEDSELFAGLDADARFYFVHSYAVHDWTLETHNPVLHRAQGDLVHARQAVRGRRGERRPVGHPVPPREVRRRRSPAPHQLDRNPVATWPSSNSSPPSTSATARPSASCTASPARRTPHEARKAALAGQRAGAEWLHRSSTWTPPSAPATTGS